MLGLTLKKRVAAEALARNIEKLLSIFEGGRILLTLNKSILKKPAKTLWFLQAP